MAAAGAEKHAAAAGDPPAVPEQGEKVEEKEAVFAAKHAEMVSEARAVARDHGVAVTTVAFRPDGTAVADEFVGVSGGEQVRAVIGRAVARKVAAMESGEELAAHRRELLMLRGIVAGKLQEANKKVAPPGQKEETDGGGEVVDDRRGQTGGGTRQQEMDGDASAGAGAGCDN